jgi:hypothetical protein
MSPILFPILPPSEYLRAPSPTGARRVIASFLLGALLTVLHAVPALAEMEFEPSSVRKGVLLVASPTLDDPNFRQAVVLVVEHGPEGTLGLILNRSTNVLLSEALPEITVLKGTTYRLFVGGPRRAKPSSFAVPTQGASSRCTTGFRRGLCGGHTCSPGTHRYAGQSDRNLPGFCRICRMGSGAARI